MDAIIKKLPYLEDIKLFDKRKVSHMEMRAVFRPEIDTPLTTFDNLITYLAVDSFVLDADEDEKLTSYPSRTWTSGTASHIAEKLTV